MRPPAILLLTAVSTALAGSLSIKTLVFPAETSNSFVEMVPQRPIILRSFTLCMRVATELSGKREIILFAYRTRNNDELNVWRELDGRLSFYLAGDGVLFKVPELGALQTHLCFTWDSSSGLAALYMDGKRSSYKIYRKGHTIMPGGKVILGQDPDSYLGDFDNQQSFVGEIYDVNMWDVVLSESKIQDVFAGKREPRGNVFDWETELRINGHRSPLMSYFQWGSTEGAPRNLKVRTDINTVYRIMCRYHCSYDVQVHVFGYKNMNSKI